MTATDLMNLDTFIMVGAQCPNAYELRCEAINWLTDNFPAISSSLHKISLRPTHGPEDREIIIKFIV